MRKKGGLLGLVRSERFKYAFMSLGGIALGVLLIIPLSGVVGILWTLMSAAFGVYTVFFHPFSEGRQPIDLSDRPEDGPPSGEGEP